MTDNRGDTCADCGAKAEQLFLAYVGRPRSALLCAPCIAKHHNPQRECAVEHCQAPALHFGLLLLVPIRTQSPAGLIKRFRVCVNVCDDCFRWLDAQVHGPKYTATVQT
jgi:hypothetical protein